VRAIALALREQRLKMPQRNSGEVHHLLQQPRPAASCADALAFIDNEAVGK
jgi:hypothetical protein